MSKILTFALVDGSIADIYFFNVILLTVIFHFYDVSR